MKNKIYIFIILFLGLFLFYTESSKAAENIGIYIDETEHTIVYPYEKSFRSVIKIINHSNEIKTVRVEPQEEMPKGGHLLIPIGEYKLNPGQEAHCVAVFEASTMGRENNSSIEIPIRFKWEGGEETYNFKIQSKNLPFREKNTDLSNVEFEILGKYSNDVIEGANVIAMLPTGLEYIKGEYNKGKYYLDLPSKEYLNNIKEEYKIDLENTGYFLQISKDGYKNYFKSNFLPKKGKDKRTLSLEPLEKVGKYNLENTIRSGYSIWWLKSSSDGVYITASQGAHGQPDVEPPLYSKVLLLSEEGKKIWENDTGGECWGLDITSDGKYIAAGCHDGNIYLWDRNGEKKWEYSNEFGNQVRWVKFSPNGQYLLSGPVNNKPEESGLFDVETGELIWTYYTGDYLREGDFLSDNNTVYLDSANGLIHSLDVATGNLNWVGNGDHYIPFMFHLSESTKQIYATGKGLSFTALELDTGKFRWQSSVDQTITAANTAQDGSIIGVSVGGMVYKVNKIGEIEWARNYGGVGHNGVHYTKNGKYILLGGPNPTLMDSDGNVLWQKNPKGEVEMTGPAEQWTGGANDVWINESASLIVLGGDDGNIDFYNGIVGEGENNLKQTTGPFSKDINKNIGFFDNFKKDNKDSIRGNEIELPKYLPFLGALGLAVIILIVIIIVLIKWQKKK